MRLALLGVGKSLSVVTLRGTRLVKARRGSEVLVWLAMSWTLKLQRKADVRIQDSVSLAAFATDTRKAGFWVLAYCWAVLSLTDVLSSLLRFRDVRQVNRVTESLCQVQVHRQLKCLGQVRRLGHFILLAGALGQCINQMGHFHVYHDA